MTLFSGLQQKRTLAGLVVMSGYLAGASTIKPTEEGLKTPILHCHGDSDSMVLPAWAEETKQRVLEHGHSGGYTLKTCALLGSLGPSLSLSLSLSPTFSLDFSHSIHTATTTDAGLEHSASMSARRATASDRWTDSECRSRFFVFLQPASTVFHSSPSVQCANGSV